MQIYDVFFFNNNNSYNALSNINKKEISSIIKRARYDNLSKMSREILNSSLNLKKSELSCCRWWTIDSLSNQSEIVWYHHHHHLKWSSFSHFIECCYLSEDRQEAITSCRASLSLSLSLTSVSSSCIHA